MFRMFQWLYELFFGKKDDVTTELIRREELEWLEGLPIREEITEVITVSGNTDNLVITNVNVVSLSPNQFTEPTIVVSAEETETARKRRRKRKETKKTEDGS